MAEDWAADVKKFVADADDKVIAAIVRYCGIALQSRDASLVSFSDPEETGRVRENFLKNKLGLTQSDEALDQAIAAVGERMKGTSFRNRVTVYYLLLDHFGLLHLFGGVAAGVGAAGAAAAAGVAGAQSALGSYDAGEAGEDKVAGFGWWPWLLLALLALALIWWLFFRQPGTPETGQAITPANDIAAVSNAVDAGANASINIVDFAAAPAEGSVAIPAGAGVTVEMRDAKPVAKVYFDTGEAALVPAFAATADGFKAYLASHAGSTLAVSGFNDKTGNAAANAELSKHRAEAVKAALVSAGIADASVALVKPEDTTDTTATNEAARRVEIVVR